MKSFVFLFAWVMASASATGQTRIASGDYIRCTAHMEQASQRLILGEYPAEDIAEALRCKPTKEDTAATLGLTRVQLLQLGKIAQLFSTQLRAPTPTVHLRLSDEIAAFVATLR